MRTAQVLYHGVSPEPMYWNLNIFVTVPSEVLRKEKSFISMYCLEFQEMHGVPKFGTLALEFYCSLKPLRIRDLRSEKMGLVWTVCLLVRVWRDRETHAVFQLSAKATRPGAIAKRHTTFLKDWHSGSRFYQNLSMYWHQNTLCLVEMSKEWKISKDSIFVAFKDRD